MLLKPTSIVVVIIALATVIRSHWLHFFVMIIKGSNRKVCWNALKYFTKEFIFVFFASRIRLFVFIFQIHSYSKYTENTNSAHTWKNLAQLYLDILGTLISLYNGGWHFCSMLTVFSALSAGRWDTRCNEAICLIQGEYTCRWSALHLVADA